MPTSNSSVRRFSSKFRAGKALLIAAFLTLLLSSCALISAAQDDSYDARKKAAAELCKQGKCLEALPVLEKLHEERSDDGQVLEGLSIATLAHSATLSDPAARKEERIKARKFALGAQAAGDNSNMVKTLVELPEDGSEAAFSTSPEVEATMREGEAAFSKGDTEGAIAAYKKALVLDPKQYSAALFIGDVYFKKADHAHAEEWFLKAIQIDPNRETAYRYWGDDLVAQDRASEAKEQFIKAIVAQPYARISWMGLSQWAQKQKMVLRSPAINPPGKVEDKGKNEKGQNQTNVTIDMSMLDPKAKKDGTDSWFIYTLLKAGWHGERFQKEFPNEKEYRHSLAEEMDGFQMVVSQVKEKLKKKEIKALDPELASLVKLSDEGLLESYILISRADQGIAKDYEPYRNSHRDKIGQYISEWIIQPAP
jgi:tetratricopeptide (TPR) repeat protein